MILDFGYSCPSWGAAFSSILNGRTYKGQDQAHRALRRRLPRASGWGKISWRFDSTGVLCFSVRNEQHNTTAHGGLILTAGENYAQRAGAWRADRTI